MTRSDRTTMKNYPTVTTYTVEYTRLDGSTGCVMTGSAAHAEKDARYYTGLGYTVRIDATTACAECGGRGERPHKRKRWAMVRCRACRG